MCSCCQHTDACDLWADDARSGLGWSCEIVGHCDFQAGVPSRDKSSLQRHANSTFHLPTVTCAPPPVPARHVSHPPAQAGGEHRPDDIVIVSAVRTPLTRANKGGFKVGPEGSPASCATAVPVLYSRGWDGLADL